MKGKSLSSIRRKKLFPISCIIVLLCLTPIFVIWTFAQTSPTLSLNIDATGAYQKKGNCFQASIGTIMVGLDPETNTFGDTKSIGKVESMVTYSYQDLASLTLVVDMLVHIHIDGSFRRLNEGEFADITLMEIRGCTTVDQYGVQYCVYVNAGNVGTVTRTGPNEWQVDALIPSPEYGAQSLCVNQWSGSEVVDGFCIPLYGYESVITGKLTM